jgi:hypothetical protein
MSCSRIKTIASLVLVAMALTLSASAQTARKDRGRDKLIGAWRLVRIDAPGPDGQPASGPNRRACRSTRDTDTINVSGLKQTRYRMNTS